MSFQGSLKSEDILQESFLETLVGGMLPESREGDSVVIIITKKLTHSLGVVYLQSITL